MKNIDEFYKAIKLSEKVVTLVKEANKEIDFALYEEFYPCFLDKNKMDEGFQEISKKIPQNDNNNITLLAVFLYFAFCSLSIYKEKGISEEIYLATMKAFSRFMEETKDIFGRYIFDRGFWIFRQIGLHLFRIGELEYEMIELSNTQMISIHIPSDAKLEDELLEASFKKSRDFFSTYFPSYKDAPYICASWMLSPELKLLLPNHSNIIRFQNRFIISVKNDEIVEYERWVFKRLDHDVNKYKEETTLQRNLKGYLLEGKTLTSAYGVLK